ncbi:MAG: hypothetical protein MN733_34610 [Nitrososphaera sp.]|nr:hypothetical protein [Nitrososphaera sp.]
MTNERKDIINQINELTNKLTQLDSLAKREIPCIVCAKLIEIDQPQKSNYRAPFDPATQNICKMTDLVDEWDAVDTVAQELGRLKPTNLELRHLFHYVRQEAENPVRRARVLAAMELAPCEGIALNELLEIALRLTRSVSSGVRYGVGSCVRNLLDQGLSLSHYQRVHIRLVLERLRADDVPAVRAVANDANYLDRA